MPADHPEDAAYGATSPNADAPADDPHYVGEGISVPVGVPRELPEPGVGWFRIPETPETAAPAAAFAAGVIGSPIGGSGGGIPRSLHGASQVGAMHPNDDVSVPAVQYTWTAQRGDVGRFSRLAMWRVFRRPIVMVYFALLVVALVVAVWSGEEELATLFAVIVVGFPLALFVQVLRMNRIMVRPGARWASGFNSFGMLLEDPVAQIVIGHGSIAKLEVDHGLVYLYVRGGMGRAARVPESLCPPEARAYLLSMVDARSRGAHEATSPQ